MLTKYQAKGANLFKNSSRNFGILKVSQIFQRFLRFSNIARIFSILMIFEISRTAERSLIIGSFFL